MDKRYNLPKDIATMNLYASNNIASNYTEENLIEKQGVIKKYQTLFRNLNINKNE